MAGCRDRPPLEPAVGEAPEATAARASDSDTAETADSLDRFLVVLEDDLIDPGVLAADFTALHGGEVHSVWRHALRGFSVDGLPEAGVDALRNNPAVAFVERDDTSAMGAEQVLGIGTGEWGLDRVDSHPLQYDERYEYYFAGSGAHIYILDTGINGDHVEFTGRLGQGKAIVSSWTCTGPYCDQHGHGTSVASVAGGSRAGIAKDATLHSVRINVTGDAQNSDIVDGLNWVAENAIHPAVANLSYVGSSSAVSTALQGVMSEGVVMVVGAGNEGQDACNWGWNNLSGIWVASGSDVQDRRVTDQNYGSCVDFFAPGAGVIGAMHDDDSGFKLYSGTSYAAPFVAGLAAVIKAEIPRWTDPYQVYPIVEASATHGALMSIGAGSPNILINALHRYAVVQGPADVTSGTSDTSASWDAEVYGGDGNWTFSWEASVDGGPWQVVGTSQTYQRTIEAYSSYALDLGLTATSLGVQRTDSMAVTVTYECQGGGPC